MKIIYAGMLRMGRKTLKEKEFQKEYSSIMMHLEDKGFHWHLDCWILAKLVINSLAPRFGRKYSERMHERYFRRRRALMYPGAGDFSM